MKSMKVRKLAALGVAAALAATPVAMAAVNTANLPTDKSWYTNSNIVVGKNAIASDVVAAADIAAAIAGLAYQNAEIEASSSGDAKVKLSVPGEIVVGGEGYTDSFDSFDIDPNTSTLDVAETYGPAKVTTLLDNADISFRYKEDDGDWEDGEGKVKEELAVKLDIVADQVADADEAEIRAKTEADGMKYTLTLSNVDELLSSSKTYETKNLHVNILGDKYEITDVDMNSSPEKITLVSFRESKTVEVGGTIEFEGYTIKVVDINPEQDDVYLQLLDAQGNEVASDVLDTSGNNYTDFDGTLSDGIKVDTVFAGTETKFVKLELKAEEMVLDKGTEKELEDYSGWYIKWTTGGNDSIVFDVYYMGDEDDSYLTFDTGMNVGDTLKFAGSAGYGVSFMGFENEPMKDVKFDGDDISFVDEDGVSHEGVLFKEISGSSIVDGTDTISTTVYDFIDGEKAKIEIIATGKLETVDGTGTDNDLNMMYEVKVDVGADGTYDLDGDIVYFVMNNVNTSQATNVPGKLITVEATNGGYQYNVYVEASVEANTDQITSIDGTMIRVAFASNGIAAPDTPDEDTPYVVAVTDTGNDGIPDEWNVMDIGDNNIVVLFNTTDKELDFENDTIDVAGIVNVDADADNSDPENYWTNAGTEVYVRDDDTVEIKVPIDKRKMKVFVGIPQEVQEGENYIEGKEGDTVNIGAYEVKIEEIVTGAPEISGTYYEKTADFNPVGMTVLDSEAGNGNLIVVGGWNANEIAERIRQASEGIESELEQDKEIVNKYSVEGQDIILVAGWEAEDTRSAAKKFAEFIKEQFQ